MENSNPDRKPDNTVIKNNNGTKYIINEFLKENGKENINDIIAKRIKRELDPGIPKGEI